MSTENEGKSPAPESLEAQALAELEEEGHTIEGKEPAPVVEPVKEPEKPKEEPKELVKEPERPARTPTMVEAWKLNVAEDQKQKALTRVTELEAEVKKISEQKGPVTVTQEKEIADEIKAIADETGADATVLTRMAEIILKRAPKPSGDVEKKLQTLEKERELQKQLDVYNSEFEKDVLPLVKDYNLSAESLSQLKSTLKDYAFSDTYSRVPLAEIFKIKEGSLELKAPKKSSEGKGLKVRENDAVDLENLSEEDFAKLPADKAEEFVKRKSAGGWQKPGSHVARQ